MFDARIGQVFPCQWMPFPRTRSGKEVNLWADHLKMPALTSHQGSLRRLTCEAFRQEVKEDMCGTCKSAFEKVSSDASRLSSFLALSRIQKKLTMALCWQGRLPNCIGTVPRSGASKRARSLGLKKKQYNILLDYSWITTA